MQLNFYLKTKITKFDEKDLGKIPPIKTFRKYPRTVFSARRHNQDIIIKENKSDLAELRSEYAKTKIAYSLLKDKGKIKVPKPYGIDPKSKRIAFEFLSEKSLMHF